MTRSASSTSVLVALLSIVGTGCQREMDVSEFAITAAEAHIKQVDEALSRAADARYFANLVDAYDGDSDREDPDYDDGEWLFTDEITVTRYRFESEQGDPQEDPDDTTDRIEIELDIDTKTLPLFPTDRTRVQIESRAKNLVDGDPEVKISFVTTSEFVADASEVVTNGEAFADLDLDKDLCPTGEFSGTVSARGKSPLLLPGSYAVDYLVWYDKGTMSYQVLEDGKRTVAEGSRESICD